MIGKTTSLAGFAMFADRIDAGNRLGNVLMDYKNQDVVVYALPRGGVVVGAQVAGALHAPMDLILARKLGHPEVPEYAIGAVTEDGGIFLNPAEANFLDPAWISEAAANELQETHRQREVFLHDRYRIPATGRVAIIVDDGLATGLTMEAAIECVKKQGPARIVVAVPVAAAGPAARLRLKVDEILALEIPATFRAVGSFYRNFNQVTDEDVIALMRS